MGTKQAPKVLFVDIETSPILAHVWGLFDQNVALNQVKNDWHLLSWAAKWLGDSPKKTMYMDQRGAKSIDNDHSILLGIHKLLDEADIVVGQNSKRFDVKKLNSRFIINDLDPPSPFRQIDTLQLAKKHFGFTSNKLEYTSEKLCKKYKKLKHHKFSGFELWKECLAGNKKAWNEMKKYNIHDVLALEELYKKLQPWDNSINFNVYTDSVKRGCQCGDSITTKKGFSYTNSGKFQIFQCDTCRKYTTSKNNLLSDVKKESLRK